MPLIKSIVAKELKNKIKNRTRKKINKLKEIEGGRNKV